MIFTIARRELGLLFRSPLAWFIAAALQALFAWLFLTTLEEYLRVQPQLSLQDHAPGVTAYMTFRYMAPVSTLFLIVCPLLTMRLYADEFRLRTYSLLASAPLGIPTLVIGKFLGVWLFFLLLIVLVVAMPLCLAPLSGIDVQTLLLAASGLLCLAAAATAIGAFCSSLTQHTLTAALLSIAALALLWLLGKGTPSDPLGQELIATYALSTQLGHFFQGIANSANALWFLIITLLFLSLTMLRLENQRHRPLQ